MLSKAAEAYCRWTWLFRKELLTHFKLQFIKSFLLYRTYQSKEKYLETISLPNCVLIAKKFVKIVRYWKTKTHTQTHQSFIVKLNQFS